MIKQEFPAFSRTLFCPLRPQLHSFFAIKIIFGYIFHLHLLALRSLVAAKKYDPRFGFDFKYNMLRTMAIGMFIMNITINRSAFFCKPMYFFTVEQRQ